MKRLLNKFGWWIVKKTCNHSDKFYLFDDYQNECSKYFCVECQSEIYKDL